MDKRQANLTEKRDSLNVKLADGSLTPERRTKLNEKLLKVQDKITALEAKRQQMASCGPRRGRGGCGAGRGRWRNCDASEDTVKFL